MEVAFLEYMDRRIFLRIGVVVFRRARSVLDEFTVLQLFGRCRFFLTHRRKKDSPVSEEGGISKRSVHFEIVSLINTRDTRINWLLGID